MTLGKSTAAAFLVKALGVLLFTSFTIVLARLVSKDDYGVIIFGFGLLSLLAPICLLGFDRVSLKFAAVYGAESDGARLRGLYIRACQVALGASAVVLVLTGIAALFGLYDPRYGMGQAVFYGLFLLPFWAYVTLNRDFQRGLKMVVPALLGFNIIRPAVAFILVLIATAYMPLTPPLVFACLAVGLGLALILDVFRIRKALSRLVSPHVVYEDKVWAGAAKPLLFSTIMNAVMSRGDLVLVGVFLSSGATAHYGAALRLAALLIFVLDAVRIVIAPHISENAHTQNWDLMQEQVSRAASWIFITTIPGAILLMLFPELFLSLFGEAYKEAAPVLVILAAGQLISALAGPIGPLMTMTDLRGLHAQIMAGTTGLFLLLSIVLISFYGVIGAAIAFSCTLLVRNGIMVFVVHRRLHIMSYVQFSQLVRLFGSKQKTVRSNNEG